VRGEARQVTFGFGHDFRVQKLWIVEVGTGKKIAELSTESGLTDKELELCARVIRSAPVMTKAMTEAESRLRHAKHPNAVKLRQMIHDALRGLEEPIFDTESDRIDP
jgi:hypothetical protein